MNDKTTGWFANIYKLMDLSWPVGHLEEEDKQFR
jgi:hypothetical protein